MHCTGSPQRPTATKRREAGITILVVEDEQFVREVTCEILRHAGYRVVQAECAATATKMFLRQRKRIRLLLCDAVLPDSSGALLSQTLRRLSPELNVIVVSGYPSGGRPEAGDTESANDFLAKPYGAASLVSRVQAGVRKESVREPVQIQAR